MRHLTKSVIALCATFAIGTLFTTPGGAWSAEQKPQNPLNIQVGEPFEIASAPPTFAFPTLQQLAPKELRLVVWSAPDAYLKEEERRQTVLCTSDGGLTWGAPTIHLAAESGGHSFICRKDGTCVWLGLFTHPLDGRTLCAHRGLSPDGKTFTWGEGRVRFPENILIVPWQNGLAMMDFARSIIELPDGSLLATMYGNFASDIGGRDAEKIKYGENRYRTLLVRSTDGGTNWDYYSTVAFNPDAAGEGYGEPVLTRTTDGSLLCVMRRGSALPMASCRSVDDGLTWDEPRLLPDDALSVFPDMVLMSNGVLALSSGRPGIYVKFSHDGTGKEWTPRIALYEDPHWPTPASTCGYTALREVAPGRLLCIYSFLENLIKPGALSHMRGVFIDVNRK